MVSRKSLILLGAKPVFTVTFIVIHGCPKSLKNLHVAPLLATAIVLRTLDPALLGTGGPLRRSLSLLACVFGRRALNILLPPRQSEFVNRMLAALPDCGNALAVAPMVVAHTLFGMDSRGLAPTSHHVMSQWRPVSSLARPATLFHGVR